MEDLIRGVLEKDLDRLLDETIETEVGLIDRLELLIKSKEDYLRGFVVGYLNGVLRLYLFTLSKQNPTMEDFKELYDRIISGRSAEIEQKIMQSLMK